MKDEIRQERAQGIFRRVQEALRDQDWRYQTEGQLSLHFAIEGFSLNASTRIWVEPEEETVYFQTRLPGVIHPDKLELAARAIGYTNDQLAIGNFGLDQKERVAVFFTQQCYTDSVIGKEALSFMAMVCCGTADEYGGRMEKLLTEQISWKQFEKLFEE